MPMQPINFLNVPVQGDPTLEAILPSFAAGMKLSQEPAKYKADMQQEQIQNALLQNQLNYAPQMSEADLRLKDALSQYKSMMVANPLLGQGGPAGQVGALMYLQGLGGKAPQQMQGQAPSINNMPLTINPNDVSKLVAQGIAQPGTVNPEEMNQYANLIQSSLNANTKKNQAQADYQDKRAKAFAYATAPVDVKNNMIATLVGAGLYPDQAANLLAQGKTMPEILSNLGFDPANPPDPDYAPIKGNIESLQKRKMFSKELNSVEDFTTQGMAPYASKFAGFSPEQISDALKNEDPDKQARYIAARGLQPELASMRLNIMGGRVGIGAIQEMMDKSLGNTRIFEGSVMPEVYAKAQQYMNQQIKSAFENASKDLLKSGRNNVGKDAQTITKSLSESSSQSNAQQQQTYQYNGQTYTYDDVVHTAKLRGMTVDQVLQQMGVQ